MTKPNAQLTKEQRNHIETRLYEVTRALQTKASTSAKKPEPAAIAAARAKGRAWDREKKRRAPDASNPVMLRGRNIREKMLFSDLAAVLEPLKTLESEAR